MSARAASVRAHAQSAAACVARGARDVVGLTLCAAGFALASAGVVGGFLYLVGSEISPRAARRVDL